MASISVRIAVEKNGVDSIMSASEGAIVTRTRRKMISKWTMKYPGDVAAINKWACLNKIIPADFEYESITINKGYSSTWHRDNRNRGKSVVVALRKLHRWEV